MRKQHFKWLGLFTNNSYQKLYARTIIKIANWTLFTWWCSALIQQGHHSCPSVFWTNLHIVWPTPQVWCVGRVLFVSCCLRAECRLVLADYRNVLPSRCSLLKSKAIVENNSHLTSTMTGISICYQEHSEHHCPQSFEQCSAGVSWLAFATLSELYACSICNGHKLF